ncbi:cell division protein FtsL [Sutcliffiella cohnii]
MSNLAHKIQRNHEHQQQPTRKQQVVIRKKARITLGEKLLIGLFLALVTFSSIHLVSNHVTIYDVNKEIRVLETSVQEQQLANRDLQLKVAELSTSDRILQKAKELGLTINESSVKNVRD